MHCESGTILEALKLEEIDIFLIFFHTGWVIWSINNTIKTDFSPEIIAHAL